MTDTLWITNTMKLPKNRQKSKPKRRFDFAAGVMVFADILKTLLIELLYICIISILTESVNNKLTESVRKYNSRKLQPVSLPVSFSEIRLTAENLCDSLILLAA